MLDMDTSKALRLRSYCSYLAGKSPTVKLSVNIKDVCTQVYIYFQTPHNIRHLICKGEPMVLYTKNVQGTDRLVAVFHVSLQINIFWSRLNKYILYLETFKKEHIKKKKKR